MQVTHFQAGLNHDTTTDLIFFFQNWPHVQSLFFFKAVCFSEQFLIDLLSFSQHFLRVKDINEEKDHISPKLQN